MPHLSNANAIAGYQPSSGRGVLMVGDFLSRKLGTRMICEEVAERLDAVDGGRVLTTSSRRGRTARLLDMLQTVLRRRREYDIAHVDVYSGPAFVWAEAVCGALRMLGKPYVLSLHGGELPQFGRQWPRRVTRLLQSASEVTAPSRYLIEQMRRYRGDILLLPNPLDLQAHRFRLRSSPQPDLVWLRAMHRVYNPVLAVRTLARLAREFPAAALTFAGPDKGDGTADEVRRVAREMGVSSRVEWQGAVPKADVPAWMNRGDVFLNTTNIDNTPVSVIEAMASGLCVVSTDVGGIPYLLEHEKDALLVPPDDDEAMAAAVRRLLTEPGLAAKLSANARATASRFDWSIILPQWQDLLAGPERQ